jgi:hypothetical protein
MMQNSWLKEWYQLLAFIAAQRADNLPTWFFAPYLQRDLFTSCLNVSSFIVLPHLSIMK